MATKRRQKVTKKAKKKATVTRRKKVTLTKNPIYYKGYSIKKTLTGQTYIEKDNTLISWAKNDTDAKNIINKLVTKENPGRPPKKWWDKMFREVSAEPTINDPAAVVGAIWSDLSESKKREILAREETSKRRRNPFKKMQRSKPIKVETAVAYIQELPKIGHLVRFFDRKKLKTFSEIYPTRTKAVNAARDFGFERAVILTKDEYLRT